MAIEEDDEVQFTVKVNGKLKTMVGRVTDVGPAERFKKLGLLKGKRAGKGVELKVEGEDRLWYKYAAVVKPVKQTKEKM